MEPAGGWTDRRILKTVILKTVYIEIKQNLGGPLLALPVEGREIHQCAGKELEWWEDEMFLMTMPRVLEA